ncbi:hypothetical protein [Luteimonas saliphila]|uniref:hypothetical protein n=1 Tax=Luteimonas saliphila TaxID=2804919 RepID=UPI00192DBD42|nr:hypothetical protein [Luteimonas saliphila]
MEFVIDPGHPALPGHFPGRPVVPGVVVLDRVIAAIERAAGPLPPLRLPQVKFLQPLLPGERARIEFEPSAPAPAARWRFRVLRGEATIASGEIVAEAAPA